jgi:hypothetical protein
MSGQGPVKVKLHVRKLASGAVFVQGVIPPPEALRLELPADAIAVGDLVLVEVEDRTTYYRGLSIDTVRRSGFP